MTHDPTPSDYLQRERARAESQRAWSTPRRERDGYPHPGEPQQAVDDRLFQATGESYGQDPDPYRRQAQGPYTQGLPVQNQPQQQPYDDRGRPYGHPAPYGQEAQGPYSQPVQQPEPTGQQPYYPSGSGQPAHQTGSYPPVGQGYPQPDAFGQSTGQHPTGSFSPADGYPRTGAYAQPQTGHDSYPGLSEGYSDPRYSDPRYSDPGYSERNYFAARRSGAAYTALVFAIILTLGVIGGEIVSTMLSTSMLTVPGIELGSPTIGLIGLIGLGTRVVLSVLVIVLAGVGLSATRPQGAGKAGRAVAGAAAAFGYLHLLLAIATAARAAIYYLQFGDGDRAVLLLQLFNWS